jgi:hypothetical protein
VAIKQVLLCPVCGKSGPINRFSIDQHGNPAADRVEHTPKIALCHQHPKTGLLSWTHHEAPLRVLVALRQQMVEALERVDAMIEEISDEG